MAAIGVILYIIRLLCCSGIQINTQIFGFPGTDLTHLRRVDSSTRLPTVRQIYCSKDGHPRCTRFLEQSTLLPQLFGPVYFT